MTNYNDAPLNDLEELIKEADEFMENYPFIALQALLDAKEKL